MKRTLVVLLAIVALGGPPLSRILCAWSCGGTRPSGQTAHHTHCDESPIPDQSVGGSAPCADHLQRAETLITSSSAPASSSTFDAHTRLIHPSQPTATMPLGHATRGADPPLPHTSSILRI
ncbi:MAG: hypothetical protein ABI051_04225 [Vicinamibacterales bacterium]